MDRFIVITTIHKKTPAIEAFEGKKGWHVIVVGDKKSSHIDESPHLTYLSVDRQKKLGFQINASCPFNHYTRKNIGYLYAMAMGAKLIYDTDDDTFPYEDWSFPKFVSNRACRSSNKFVNTYKHFSDQLIWPRGLPLDEIHGGQSTVTVNDCGVDVGVWQGLVDDDPDVDAVFRLIFKEKVKFKQRAAFHLAKGLYCPFNSQNTLWQEKAFPLMYLPTAVSFRFTDILRGYVAQRLLWELDLYLGFSSASVFQIRNHHDLMEDFYSEMQAYLHTKNIVHLIDEMALRANPSSNLLSVYQKLFEKKHIDRQTLEGAYAWAADFERILG